MKWQVVYKSPYIGYSIVVTETETLLEIIKHFRDDNDIISITRIIEE